jgi:hypothetical protein
VAVAKRLLFQHRGVSAPLEGGGAAASGATPPAAGGWEEERAGAPEWEAAGGGAGGAGRGGRWGADVYRRVFLTREAALAWHAWNRARGDPAQPYHFQGVAEWAQREVGARLPPAQRLMAGGGRLLWTAREARRPAALPIVPRCRGPPPARAAARWCGSRPAAACWTPSGCCCWRAARCRTRS